MIRLLSILTVACTLLVPSEVLARDQPLQRVHCVEAICLVAQNMRDSDGDGVSDDDELAANTDPFNPNSVPTMPNLLGLIALDKLPSFIAGGRVLSLPARAPNGAEVFGGPGGLPSRASALARLGLTSDRLSGLDLSNGLAIVRGAGAPTPGKAPPMKVGGINLALISAGKIDRSIDATRNAGAHGRDTAWNIGTKERTAIGSGEIGGQRVTYENGGSDVIRWGTDGKNTTVKVQSYDAAGAPIGGATFERRQDSDGDGGEIVTIHASHEDKPNGTSGTTDQVNHTDKDGNKLFYTDTKKTEVKPGGTTVKTQETTIYEETKGANATNKQHKTTSKETCKDGVCTKEATTTGTRCDTGEVSCDGGGVVTYVNPDEQYVMSEEFIKMRLTMLGANVTYGPKPEVGTDDPAPATPTGPRVIYVDPEAEGLTGILFGVGPIGGPDFDPRLPVIEINKAGGTPPECHNPEGC